MNWQEVIDRTAVYRMNKQGMYLNRDTFPFSVTGCKYYEEKILETTLEFTRMIRAINTDENGNVWKPDWENEEQEKWSVYLHVDKWTKEVKLMIDGSTVFCKVAENTLFESIEKAEHAWKYFKPLFEAYYLNR